MTKTEAIIFYMSVGLLLIGIHQAMTFGVQNAYGFFMLSISLLFLYIYKKGVRKSKESNDKK